MGKSYVNDLGKRAVAGAQRCAVRARCAAMRLVRGREGQGTTEYAILVGVLVVIAVLAITVFRPRIQSLWDDITSAVNGL